MDSSSQSRLRTQGPAFHRGQGQPFSRARPRSRLTESTLSTVTCDTTSEGSTHSGWTDSESDYRRPSADYRQHEYRQQEYRQSPEYQIPSPEYRMPSPPPEPVNPFFRGPRPNPQDVFRFGRRRGLAHFMKPEVQTRALQPEPIFERQIEPIFEQQPEPEPEIESEPEAEPELKEEEEVAPEPVVPIITELPPPQKPTTKPITTIIIPEVMEQSQPNDLEERFRTVSASLQDTKEAIERMEKIMMAGFGTPPQSPQVLQHTISFNLPRNPFGIYWPWIRMILMIFMTWLLCESTLCAAYCRPEYSSKSNWKPYDPLFGQAIPWKLDDWTGVRVSRAWRDYWNY